MCRPEPLDRIGSGRSTSTCSQASARVAPSVVQARAISAPNSSSKTTPRSTATSTNWLPACTRGTRRGAGVIWRRRWAICVAHQAPSSKAPKEYTAHYVEQPPDEFARHDVQIAAPQQALMHLKQAKNAATRSWTTDPITRKLCRPTGERERHRNCSVCNGSHNVPREAQTKPE